MTRPMIVLGLLVVVSLGCQPKDAPRSENNESTSLDAAKEGPIDYRGWRELTNGPVRVSVMSAFDCRSPSAVEERYGPHFAPAIRLYGNEIAASHLREDRAGPLPVGAVIVKEKYPSEKAARPMAYAAMVKREPNYDAKHGDWEYVYVTLGETPKVERGKLGSCIDCHSRVAAKDYLFRTHFSSTK